MSGVIWVQTVLQRLWVQTVLQRLWVQTVLQRLSVGSTLVGRVKLVLEILHVLGKVSYLIL